VRRVGEQGQLAVGHPRRPEPRRHALGGQRAAALGQGRVGFDQFLVKIAESRLVGPQPDIRRGRLPNGRRCQHYS